MSAPPLDFGATLRDALRIVRGAWPRMALLGVPQAAPHIYSNMRMLATSRELHAMAQLHSPDPAQFHHSFAGTAVTGLVSLLGTTLIYIFTAGALCHVTHDALLGRTRSLGAQWTEGLGRMGAVFVTQMAALGVVTLSLLLCCLPLVPALTLLVLALPLTVLERVPPVESLRTSIQLGQENFWPLLGLAAVVLAAIAAISLLTAGLLIPVRAFVPSGDIVAAAARSIVAACSGTLAVAPAVAAWRRLREPEVPADPVSGPALLNTPPLD